MRLKTRESARDKIQSLQLSVLQDYLEIKMSAHYGNEWIKEIIALCEYKVNQRDKRSHTYQKVVNDKRSKGVVMITKKSFDITLLYALLQYDFLEVCSADPTDTQVFSNYIINIKNNKNELASHISDLDDKFYIEKLERDSLFNLRNFILYLDRLGWGYGTEEQRNFVETYKEKIKNFDTEMADEEKEKESDVTEDADGSEVSVKMAEATAETSSDTGEKVESSANNNFLAASQEELKEDVVLPKVFENGKEKTEWFYYEGSEKLGPFSYTEMSDNVLQGKIQRDTLVWTTGYSEWLMAEQSQLSDELCKVAPIAPVEMISDKWMWALSYGSTALSFIAVFILSGMNLLPGNQWVVIGVKLIANIIFLTKDLEEIKKSGRDVERWMYTGVLLVPIYLFIRARNTTKNYMPLIVWCIIQLIIELL